MAEGADRVRGRGWEEGEKKEGREEREMGQEEGEGREKGGRKKEETIVRTKHAPL